ncbi:unnamed protein product [Prorocentrum cordatum]|uniref:Band 7 domain-containing protein n=1 Tax=Prorocentrum cordatum TaxID=2364126 RepID=A0ABN9RDA1_9DINO|nr:unnamed protein product [Polarella glacialis]
MSENPSAFASALTAAASGAGVAVAFDGGVPNVSPPSITTPTFWQVGAVGDPHLVNVHGQHFDIMRPGRHEFIRIPTRAWEGPGVVLLHVGALVERQGASCADMYIQHVNITGRWTGSKVGVQYDARWRAPPAVWRKYGKVALKVVQGRTEKGTPYLNLLARNLRRAGLPVGGLLGEDDHTAAATADDRCKKTVSLLQTGSAESSTYRRAASKKAHSKSDPRAYVVEGTVTSLLSSGTEEQISDLVASVLADILNVLKSQLAVAATEAPTAAPTPSPSASPTPSPTPTRLLRRLRARQLRRQRHRRRRQTSGAPADIGSPAVPVSSVLAGPRGAGAPMSAALVAEGGTILATMMIALDRAIVRRGVAAPNLARHAQFAVVDASVSPTTSRKNAAV